MNMEELKQWALENRKGLVVGLIAGFVLSRLIK